MSSVIRSGPGFRLSTLPAAIAAAALFLVALAGPAAASEMQTALRDPFVGPRDGTPSTVIRLSVTFQGQGQRSDAHVQAIIDGVARQMSATPGGMLAYGVRFRLSTTLALGTHHVAFHGVDGSGGDASLTAGTVRIHGSGSGSDSGGGTGTGTGSHTGTGGQTTSGGSKGGDGGGSAPTPTPASGSGSGGTHDGAGSTPGATSGGGQAAHPDASGPADHPARTPDGASGGSTADAIPTGAPTGRAGDDGLAIGSTGSSDGSGGGTGPAQDDGTRDLLTGGRGAIPPAERMLIAAISTTTAATTAMAFFMFGKRRRDGDPPAPDEVLAANAARLATTPASALVPGSADDGAIRRTDETAMPRWRRPSLLEARKTDPLRSTAVHDRQSFAHGAVASASGVERRRLRYRAVSLLDAPDELRATVLEELDEGDEVQLIERSGGYWFVLCPDGSQGWVHRMTLGDVVVDEDRAGAFNAARRSFAPRRTEPAWSTMEGPVDEPAFTETADGDSDIDDDGADGAPDLLSAYLEKIRRP